MNTLITQVTYNRWANLKLLRSASELSAEAFKKPITSSFSSVHKTFVHLLWAECLWFERWQSRSFVACLNPDDFPSAESLCTAIQDIHSRQLEFLEALPLSAADQIIGYDNAQHERWEYKLRDMVQHLILHSAFHRGQLGTLFRQLGIAPPHIDFLVFIDTQTIADLTIRSTRTLPPLATSSSRRSDFSSPPSAPQLAPPVNSIR
jgi:uncharacterized damage-inducible protein DinB